MKIVRIKTAKTKSKKDMFVILCLLQSAAVVLIVFLIFAVSRIDSDLFSEMQADIGKLFMSDADIGGYYTPSEDKTVQSAVISVSSAEEKEEVSEEKEDTEKTVFTVEYTENSVFDTYAADAVMPVNGKVTSEYGYRIHPIYYTESFHSGRDIAAAEGSNIYAVSDGVVIEAGQANSAGNYIKIDHGDGYYTLYCHCSALYVTEGINVRKGDVIAAVGQTGLATGPHLHFELHKDGQVTDPEIILKGAQSVN